MTSEEPDFDDPSYAEIRGLLAAHRSTDPIPVEVAARLDETLAALTGGAVPAEVAPAHGDDVVVPLRRRSKLGPRLLVAAAAVVILGAGGVGLTQVLNRSADHPASAGALSAPKVAPTAAATTLTNSTLQPESSAGGTSGTGSVGGTFATNGLGANDAVAVPAFTRARFATEAKDFTTTYYASTSTGTSEPPPGSTVPGVKSAAPQTVTVPPPVPAPAHAAPACSGPTVTDDSTVIPILYDNNPATLVLHPATGGNQLLEAWSCDGSQLLNSTVVPVR